MAHMRGYSDRPILEGHAVELASSQPTNNFPHSNTASLPRFQKSQNGDLALGLAYANTDEYGHFEVALHGRCRGYLTTLNGAESASSGDHLRPESGGSLGVVNGSGTAGGWSVAILLQDVESTHLPCFVNVLVLPAQRVNFFSAG